MKRFNSRVFEGFSMRLFQSVWARYKQAASYERHDMGYAILCLHVQSIICAKYATWTFSPDFYMEHTDYCRDNAQLPGLCNGASAMLTVMAYFLLRKRLLLAENGLSTAAEDPAQLSKTLCSLEASWSAGCGIS